MGKLLATSTSTIANKAGFLGVAAPVINNGKKRVYLHDITLAPRGADWAADVQLYLFNTYTGLGAELLDAPNFTFENDATPVYTADWSADADTWLDTSADTPTVARAATIGGRTDCLKITDVGGTDQVQIGRAATRVQATHYKITFEAFYETGGGVGAGAAFWGCGKTTACTTNALTRNGGNNQATGADNAWEDVTLYTDAGASTALDICLFTADNGATGAEFTGAGKYVAIRNLKLYAQTTTNAAAWTGTMAADDDFLWDYRNGEIDKVVNNTNAISSNDVGSITAGDLFAASYVHVRSATGVTVAFGGTTLDAAPAAGTLPQVFPVTTTAVTGKLSFTPNATLVGTIDTASLKKVNGVNTGTYFLKDSIRSGTTAGYNKTFETKQPWSTEGWGLYATTGGASCIMDMTMTYEVV